MGYIVLIVGILQAVGIAVAIFFHSKGFNKGTDESLVNLKDELEQRKGVVTKIEELKSNLIDFSLLKTKGRELLIAKESLKAERGRVTITQAELETIEIRLRELDEIARELEASGLETKEEIKILQKKEKDLNQKNDSLKQQISTSVSQMEEIVSKIEMSAQMQEQIDTIKAELLQTESQVQTLLTQIQNGNEQYFILKKRYDALDIEYAQLYEKFSEQQ